MKKIMTSVFFLGLISHSLLCQDVKSLSPQEAFAMTRNADTYLIDVRTIAEYVYLGHPEDAHCLPLLFWNEKEQNQVRNSDFLQDLDSRFTKEDTLIFICRSGSRSLFAARMALGNGFQKVYQVTEGFEGGKDTKGYRTIGGWKNSGLPYTYDIKKENSYIYR